jgi:sensor histidine kinase regulating citrate/malate metabolism
MAYLENALKTLSNFAALGLPQQILFLVVLVSVVLILLTMAIITIATYFKQEGIRRAQAFAEAERIRTEREKNLERLQADLIKDAMENLDDAYQEDYIYYKDKISVGKYADIWGKIPQQFQEEIASFVYKDELKPEDRSARIILTVRKK